MSFRPPSSDPAYFKQLLDHLQSKNWPSKIDLAGRGSGKPSIRNSPLDISVDARISILLTGRRRITVNRRDARNEIGLLPGAGLYWPPHAWSDFKWEEPFRSFGIVFRPSFTRYLVTDYRGGPHSGTPWTWHTTRPLGGVGFHLIRAMNVLAAEPDADLDLAQRLAVDLLRQATHHLEADAENPGTAGAGQTWRRVVEHVRTNFADPRLSRDSVAEALGIHPNYLSALARQAGTGFHQTLEAARMSQAKHLLEETPQTLEEIAQQCGYAGARPFLRAYKRIMGVTPGAGRRQRTL